MKKYYVLVVSVLDEYGNRTEAIEVAGSNNKKDIQKERTKLVKEVESGKYDKYANFENGESLMVDIEVHSDESYELLWIE